MDFQRFSPDTFEEMIRALAVEIIGPSVSIFGDGPDGGREAAWNGNLPETCVTRNSISGYGVIQAKFKQNLENVERDNRWAIALLRAELQTWATSARRSPKPEFLIFCTNVRLSSSSGGGKDKAHSLLSKATFPPGGRLKGFDIWDGNKLSALIDAKPNIRQRWTDFFTPGDALYCLNETVNALRGAKAIGSEITPSLEQYRRAIIARLRHLKMEVMSADLTFLNDIELRSVFIPPNARCCDALLRPCFEVPRVDYLIAALSGQQENYSNDDQLRVAIALLSDRENLKSQPEYPALEIVTNPNHMRTIILGDPGTGKTSLISTRLLEWAGGVGASTPVPIIVELRDYYCRGGGSDILDYLSQTPGLLCKWPVEGLRSALAEGSVTLLFEGLDEVFDSKRRETVVKMIVELSILYPRAPMHVTSRCIGYRPRALHDVGFQHWVLQGFDEMQMRRFIDKWVIFALVDEQDQTKVRKRLNNALKIESVRSLGENPLLLTMMAMLARQRELPKDVMKLYEKCVELLLELWDIDKAYSGFATVQGERIDVGDKHAILRSIAAAMQSEQRKAIDFRGNIIARSSLENHFHSYLLPRIPDKARRAILVDALIDQLRERNFILCHLGGEYYAFVHRGFLEFYAAQDILHRFKETQQLTRRSLYLIFQNYMHYDAWHEVLSLMIAGLDPSTADYVLGRCLWLARYGSRIVIISLVVFVAFVVLLIPSTTVYCGVVIFSVLCALVLCADGGGPDHVREASIAFVGLCLARVRNPGLLKQTVQHLTILARSEASAAKVVADVLGEDDAARS